MGAGVRSQQDLVRGKVVGSVKWVGAPLIVGDWFDLLPDEAKNIIAVLSDYLQSAELPAFLDTAQVQRMRSMSLAVYPGWLLIECQARISGDAVVLFSFLFGPNGAVLLDGRSDAVHALNELIGVSIAETGEAAEYLAFYCSAVRTGLGRFEIIATLADLAFAAGTTQGQKAEVRRQLTALKQKQADDRGFVFDATVRYGLSLYKTQFLVPPNGRVQMLEDNELDFEARLETEQFEGPFRIPAARSR